MNSADIAKNTFLKAMKSMNVKRSLIGIGIASAVGVSAQPVNMYLTKRKQERADSLVVAEKTNLQDLKSKRFICRIIRNRSSCNNRKTARFN